MSKRRAKPRWERWFGLALAAVLILCVSPGAWAQKNKKNKNTDDSSSATDQTGQPAVSGSVFDQIDTDIGEMLGAFQLGNVDLMHKHYADNATFVSGAYAPPVVGWANYVPIYQRERAQFQGMQLIRRNTYIYTHADVAWASYQWEFESILNGQPYMARGQTTLVFTKVGDNWLIVHNHTSEICLDEASRQMSAAPPSQAPAINPANQPAKP
jgi:ketosteroid isomerase-like protein